MEILRTQRLFLRPFHIRDHAAMCSVFCDPDVMRFGDGAHSPEWVSEWLKKTIGVTYTTWGFGPYAVVESASKRTIGYCGLFYFPDIGGSPEVEVGYRLARDTWGKGYATESASAVRDYAFDVLGLDKLIAIIDPINTASIRVAEKLGMRFSGREHSLPGYTHPDQIFELSRIQTA